MNNKKMIMISIVSCIAVLLLAVVAIQNVKNKAIVYEEQINTATSDLNIQGKRRTDLLFNLVDCVKEYDKHEYKTLKEIVKSRSGDNSNISDITTMIAATVESYPNLKSNKNYKTLMNELSLTENIIAQHRSNYNKQVKQYKRFTRQFPNNSILSLLGYEEIEYEYLNYDVSDDAPQNLFSGR